MLSACIRLAREIFQVSKDVSVDAVDISPDLGATIVLKTVEMAIWRKKADDMNAIRESFVTGFIFTYVQNIFLWPSYGEEGNRSQWRIHGGSGSQTRGAGSEIRWDPPIKPLLSLTDS